MLWQRGHVVNGPELFVLVTVSGIFINVVVFSALEVSTKTRVGDSDAAVIER